MPRKLKSYVTSLGFFDLAIAAPSMKAALDAWGSNTNLFHQGVAKETSDPEIVAATMSRPGAVLRRPVGSDGPFTEHAELPAHLGGDESGGKSRKRPERPSRLTEKIDDKAAHKPAREFEKAQRQRETERRREEALRARQRERREQAIQKAQAALDKAQLGHETKASAIAAERAAIEERAQAEEALWRKQKEKLEAALRRARD
jgi:hypothetical protein